MTTDTLSTRLAELLEAKPDENHWEMAKHECFWLPRFVEFHPTPKYEWVPIPFTTDLNACHAAESELERRGLAVEYAQELHKLLPVIDHDDFTDPSMTIRIYTDAFNAIHATAEQRTRAMIAVLEAAQKGETA